MTHLSKNYLIVFLALVGVAGGAVTWRQFQELTTWRSAALLSGDPSDLRLQLTSAQQRLRELEDQLAARRSTEFTAAGGDGAMGAREGGNGGRGFGGPGGRGGRGGRDGGEFRAVIDSPEGQRLMQSQQKLALDGRFAPLFKNLNLSPEKLEKFKALLLEKQVATQDVMAAVQEQGLDPRTSRDEVRKLIAATQAEIDGSLKTLLGDEAFAQYEQYQQTQPQRNLVTQLQQSLSYTNAPLSTAQADQLVQILASTTPTPAEAPQGRGGPPDGMGRGGFGGGMGGGGGGGPGGGNAVASITTAAVTQAQQVLTAPQLEALQQLQQTQQAQQQLNQLMRAGRGEPATPRGGG